MPKQFPITEFDMLTLPDYLQILKAVVPFMEYGMQRHISMLIRANELKHTIDFYKNPLNCNSFKSCNGCAGISSESSLTDILNNEALMNTVIQYCPENISNMISTFKNFSKMSDLFNLYNTFSGANNNDNSSSNPMSSFMNASQQKMYDDYIKQLDHLDLGSDK